MDILKCNIKSPSRRRKTHVGKEEKTEKNKDTQVKKERERMQKGPSHMQKSYWEVKLYHKHNIQTMSKSYN